MRTLFYLEPSAARGGIEIFAERHAAALRAAGREVEIAHEVPADLAPFDEIVVHKCTDLATLERFPPERTVLYVHDHDPICPRSYAYTPLRRNCTRASGVWPCLLCAPLCRAWRPALARVLSQRRRKRDLARLRGLVVISEFMKRRLVANGIPEGKIVVEPPKIPVGGGGTAAVPPDVDLLFVGQLIRGKGVQLLLRAMAERLGVADRVRFRGFQADPQAWMRAAACVVVPSFWQEPYGLVAAEAVALGRPVVAFAIGGLPEACGGKATLVPPGDVAALAAALDSPTCRPADLTTCQPAT